MAGAVVNAQGFMTGLDRSAERFEKRFSRRVRKIMNEAMMRLLRRTPVNTGQAVMNYVATKGGPYTGPAKEAGAPVEATNPLPVGAEALRGGAEAVALATLATVDFSNPYDVYWITNRAPHIGGLEAGELPHEPHRQRSPQGMFAITLQELSAMLDSGRV